VIQTPTYFILGTKLYIGGGYATTELSWYEYDMTQGDNPAAWRTLTSLPENMLNGNGFAVGGTGYVQTGEFTSAGNNLLYKFYTAGPSDPGTWTAVEPLNVNDGPATSFVLGNTVYFGGGSATAVSDPSIDNAFFSITPPSQTVNTIAPIPESTNPSPAQRFSTWTIGNIAYAYDFFNRTIFSYNPTTNSWTQITTLPAASIPPGDIVGFATYYNGHVLAWDATGAVWEYTGSL
jgi:N-acetylneuraminic acid mutarotase